MGPPWSQLGRALGEGSRLDGGDNTGRVPRARCPPAVQCHPPVVFGALQSLWPAQNKCHKPHRSAPGASPGGESQSLWCGWLCSGAFGAGGSGLPSQDWFPGTPKPSWHQPSAKVAPGGLPKTQILQEHVEREHPASSFEESIEVPIRQN